MSEEFIISTETEECKLNRELSQIQRWFQENDWKPNKIITGEWTTHDQRWLDYLAERLIKRNRQDEIKNILNIE